MRTTRRKVGAHTDHDEAPSGSSAQESDFEDDPTIDVDYTTFKSRERDRALLVEEEERENLLTVGSSSNSFKRSVGGGLNDGSNTKIGHGKRRGKDRRRGQPRKKKVSRKKDEAGEFMYEMEEGGGREDTSSLSSSSSAELDRLKYDYSSTLKVGWQQSLP